MSQTKTCKDLQVLRVHLEFRSSLEAAIRLRCLAAPSRADQSGSHEAVGPDVLDVLIAKKFAQPRAGAVHAAFDRADPGAADPGRLFVSETFGPDEQDGFALLD